MKKDRLIRISELLKREIGELLFRIINEDNFDLSAITVTHVIISRDLRNARVFISIRNHENERDRMLACLKKYRLEIQRCINKDITMKYTPRLSFELDRSIEEGDRILHTLSQLEKSESSN